MVVVSVRVGLAVRRAGALKRGGRSAGIDRCQEVAKAFSIGIRRSSTNFAASLSQAFLTDVLHLGVRRLKMSAV